MAVLDIVVTRKTDSTLLTLRGAMTAAQTREVREVLLSAFEMGKKVELSLAEVTTVDYAGLRLLCTAHRIGRKKGIQISITGQRPAALVWAL